MLNSFHSRRIAAAVEYLEKADRSELVALWQKTHGTAPPKGTGRRLLELSAAYMVQAKAFGGHKALIRKQLKMRLSERDPSKKNAAASMRTTISPGMRLVREWHGRTYHVDVTEQGFIWNGRNWRSLSEIAREITGARWSGPRFFGL